MRKISRTVSGAVIALAAATALAACAGNPVADEKIAVAKASLQRAERSGAPEYAPVELAAARDKVALAEKANADGDHKPAISMAEQANVDAQLAEATAEQARSHKAAMEFDAAMQTLRQESMRASPTTP